MPDPIDFVPATDSLGRRPPLAYGVHLPVLGIPVRFASNAPGIIEAVEETFGGWRAFLRESPSPAADPVHIDFIVQPGDEGTHEHAPLTYRVPDGERVVLTTPGSFGLTDPRRRSTVAYVTPALVADREHFRYGVLEALTLALLTHLDRQPLHAAALVRGTTALLLAGPSGVGKSTLAYAGLRAGFGVLADDVVHLQLRPRLRVWGWPAFLRLPADAAAHFPELAGERPTVLASGKVKIAFGIRRLGVAPVTPVVDRAGICLLSRGDRTTLERIAPATIEDELTATLEPGFDVFAGTIGEALRRLARGGGWRLGVGGPPGEAVPLLHTMFDALESAPAAVAGSRNGRP